MKPKTGKATCVCGSGLNATECCEAYINGDKTAPTAEALMRSRYTAYYQGNTAYLLDSWHQSTRPASVETDPLIKWLRLEIVDSGYDQVEFIATYKVQGKAYRLHENSQFILENQRWYYVAAIK